MNPIEKPPLNGQFNTICPVCKAVLPSPQAVCAVDAVRGVPDIPPQQIPGYVYTGLIGAGGMGVIYKARHEILGKIVAVKLLPPTNVTEKSMLRFYAEAKAVSKLSHPNIVAIHNFGVLDSGVAFMILDYIEGMTLKEFIDSGLPCPLPVFCGILAQCCDALAHAHAHGILHRDIKPGNIMVTGKPYQVSILDFGIAEMAEATARKLDLTKTGEIMGTPLYVSPEQIKGETLDARADIYALGCVMYELLVGQPPFRKSTAFATISSHLNEAPPKLPEAIEIASKVRPLLDKMLAKDRNKRYADMASVKRDLEIVSRGLKLGAREATIKIAAVSGGILVLIALVVGGFFFWQAQETTRVEIAQAESARTHTTASPRYIKQLRSAEAFSHLLRVQDGLHAPDVVYENLKLTDNELSEIDQYPGFRNLGIAGNRVTDAGLIYIAGMPLTTLDLSGNPITDAGLKIVAKIVSLEQLLLVDTAVTDAGVKFLAPLDALSEISLDKTKISDEACQSLSRMDRLESISLGDNPALTDESVRYLSRLPHLRVLNLKGTGVTEKVVPILARCKSLSQLALSGKAASKRAIKGLISTKITELELANCDVDDKDLLALTGMKELRSLYIYDCPVTQAGIDKFVSLATQTVVKNAPPPARVREAIRL